jgi:RimJ/RimL family protein N-acetyltransferase
LQLLFVAWKGGRKAEIGTMDSNLLRGSKVRLTALSSDDARTIARWHEDAGYLRLQETNTAVPRSEAEIAVELEKLREASDTMVFAIRMVEDGALIGTVGFYEIEWANRVAWLGIGIGDRTHWGKGYGSEALELTLRYAFDELNLHRLTLTVIAYNQRAIALYERWGFKREGALREFGERDGERYDLYVYGLLRSEWGQVIRGRADLARS